MMMTNIKSMMILVFVLAAWVTVCAQMQHTADFHERYTLSQVVVLSRHNIRSPLSGPESALGRITPHEWFAWSSAPSELSLRGGVLETMMGQFFRKWLVSHGLISENHLPVDGSIRFYANSMQRTIATAQYFSSGLFPVANIGIEHHYDVGTMDPVFTPRLTVVNDGYRKRALQQIADIYGNGTMEGIGQRVSENLELIEQVLDMRECVACQQGETCTFNPDDTVILLEQDQEPGMIGGLKLGCTASDALVLQYYEEQDDGKAAFGHLLTQSDWEKISAVKDWYIDVLVTAPLVAVNVAHPLLQEILAELKTEGRLFSFLCGHDSNIGSVLAAIGATDYRLPESIESKTPIGGKLVIEKWLGQDGREYAALNLCYQSVDQLRHLQLLSLQNPPMVYRVVLDGLEANEDGLYFLSDLEDRLMERIAQYDELITGVDSPQADHHAGGNAIPYSVRIYRLDGSPATDETQGIIVQEGQKYIGHSK